MKPPPFSSVARRISHDNSSNSPDSTPVNKTSLFTSSLDSILSFIQKFVASNHSIVLTLGEMFQILPELVQSTNLSVSSNSAGDLEDENLNTMAFLPYTLSPNSIDSLIQFTKWLELRQRKGKVYKELKNLQSAHEKTVHSFNEDLKSFRKIIDQIQQGSFQPKDPTVVSTFDILQDEQLVNGGVENSSETNLEIVASKMDDIVAMIWTTEERSRMSALDIEELGKEWDERDLQKNIRIFHTSVSKSCQEWAQVAEIIQLVLPKERQKKKRKMQKMRFVASNRPEPRRSKRSVTFSDDLEKNLVGTEFEVVLEANLNKGTGLNESGVIPFGNLWHPLWFPSQFYYRRW